MTQTRRSSVLKPDYDIPAVAPQREPGLTFEERRARLVRRIDEAMLTCMVQREDGPRTKWTWSPQHVREFADRIGEEEKQAPRQRFIPTPAQVDDMLPALSFLDGLRDEYLDVVFLRAFLEWRGARDWAQGVADRMRKRPEWVKDAWERAIIQATRAAGILAPIHDEYAIVCIAAYGEDGSVRTYVAAVAKPKQTMADVKAKSPTAVIDAFAVWVEGKPLATKVAADLRKAYDARSRGQWVLKNSWDVEQDLIASLEGTEVQYRLDYLRLPQVLAGSLVAEPPRQAVAGTE